MDIYGLLLLIGAYLLGSIPFGYIVVKKMKGIDIRTTGSRVIGATNVERQLGKWWGRIVLLLDVLKGFFIAALALIFFKHEPWVTAFAFSFVVLGHVFPVFLNFRGGKGVATFLGALLPLVIFCLGEFPHFWTYGGLLGVIVAWLIVHKSRKIMGLSSLFLMALLIVYFGVLTLLTSFSLYYSHLTFFIAALALFIIYNHRENWRTLQKGQGSQTNLI